MKRTPKITSYTVADFLEGIDGYCEILIRRRKIFNKLLMFAPENQYEAIYHIIMSGVPIECINKKILQMRVIGTSLTYHKELAVIIITVA